MFGFSGSDWGNMLGLRGVPGIMSSNQLIGGQLLGGMMPRQQMGPGGWDGENDDQLLASLMGGGGGQSSGGLYGSGSYIGGQGLI